MFMFLNMFHQQHFILVINKGIGQNLDNGSKNSENQKKDGLMPKIAQKCQIVSLL